MEKVRRAAAALRRLGEKGQNTVEYLMMIALVVGVVGVLGVAFRSKIGGIFSGVVNGITSAGNNLMQSNSSGN